MEKNKNPLFALFRHKLTATKILLAGVFIGMVFIPLIKMFTNINSVSLQKVFSSQTFLPALLNSIVTASIATVITLVLAYLLAISIERTKIKYKNIFSIIFVLPMLIPSISVGMGLVILLGNNGILTKLLNFEFGVYGLVGIIIGSVLYAFPVAFLMISDIMKYEDASPYEAAKVLGIGKFRRFTAITVPYMRKPMISVIFATFTLIITDYGVPLMVGGKSTTIPVIMYQEVIGQLDFGKGAVYGSLLLIPAVITFIIDLFNKDKGNSGYSSKPFEMNNGKTSKFLGYSLCILISVIVLLPIVSFIIQGFMVDFPNNLTITFSNVIKATKLKAGKYLINSLMVAFLVSIIGVVIAFLTAYMTSRVKSKASRLLHLSAITSAAIPGIVLGLSYVLVFKGSMLYGTLAILVMVNMVHFISSPYLMVYNSFSKLNNNLEDVGLTLGISRSYMIRDVIIPQCKNTIVEMFSYFFVNCMMTISAVSFLATAANKPVSLMINQFETQMQLECAAIVSLAILVSNLLVKGLLYIYKKTE